MSDTPGPSAALDPSCDLIRCIVLVGFMGSGKSTVGYALAASLGWGFLDLDAVIATAAGKSIPELFKEEGEEAFRARESDALAAILAQAELERQVLAVGGGGFVPKRNREMLQNGKALTVFLDHPLDLMWKRCREAVTERPLARDYDSFQRLYFDRLPIYEMAHLRVSTAGKLPKEIVGVIQDWLRASQPS